MISIEMPWEVQRVVLGFAGASFVGDLQSQCTVRLGLAVRTGADEVAGKGACWGGWEEEFCLTPKLQIARLQPKGGVRRVALENWCRCRNLWTPLDRASNCSAELVSRGASFQQGSNTAYVQSSKRSDKITRQEFCSSTA